jgi:hypothetical protein
LLTGFRIERSVELDATTMNGNPARIVQVWARSLPHGVRAPTGG